MENIPRYVYHEIVFLCSHIIKNTSGLAASKYKYMTTKVEWLNIRLYKDEKKINSKTYKKSYRL